MAILYQTAKFKSANILAIVILGSTAKFNSRQYFRLYDNNNCEHIEILKLTLSSFLYGPEFEGDGIDRRGIGGESVLRLQSAVELR